MPHYRVFCPENEVESLPEGLTVDEQYPAFVVVTASAAVIVEIKKRYPVEELPSPKPAPAYPAIEELAKTLAVPIKRGPYTIVVRFRAPVRQEWLDELANTGCESLAAIGSSTLVVSCPNKPTLTKLRKLESAERVVDYVPTIHISPDTLSKLGAAVDEDSLAKVTARLTDHVRDASLRLKSLPGILTASFFSPSDCNRAKRILKRQGFKNVTNAGNNLIINLIDIKNSVKAIQSIIQLRGLRSLKEMQLKKFFNDEARKVIGEGVITTNPNSLGLTGSGEILAVADSGLDTGNATTIHADFQGRVRNIQSFPIKPILSGLVNNPGGDDGAADIYSGHGTHVCGSVLGDGTCATLLGLDSIQGTAPGAELVFQAIEQTMDWNLQGFIYWINVFQELPPQSGLFGIPEDLADLFQPAYDQGARIHSNSWGGGPPGAYDEQCYSLDQFVWHHKDLLVLVAAGNDGLDINPPGHGIDTMSVSSPGTAKNCLTVGGCENNRPGEFTSETYGSWWPQKFPNEPYKSDPMADSVDDVVAFSSRGPSETGRRKPDLIAPGTFVLSTRSSQIPSNNFAWKAFPSAKNEYMFMGGTSMATPLVAGCAAVTRQYLRETEGIANPSAALLKAVLIHSGRYLQYRYAHANSTAWADNEQGWGRVDLQQCLNPKSPTSVLFLEERAGLWTGEIREFEVEVTDASVPLRATLVYSDFPGEDLVNNLNLFTYDPQGTFYVGNDFTASGSPDPDNNVEGVVVEDPNTGKWSIRVVAGNIPEGPQDFALVISAGGATLF